MNENADRENYQKRVRLMQQQHHRIPGFHSLPSCWSDILRPSVLVLPQSVSRVCTFGPPTHVLVSNGKGLRHMLHGWMVLRSLLAGLFEQGAEPLPEVVWEVMLDHRGWTNVFREQTSKTMNRSKLQLRNEARDWLMPWVQAQKITLPEPYCDAHLDGATYTAVALQPLDPQSKRAFQPLPDHVSRRLTREIFEINHRAEVRGLDALMVPDWSRIRGVRESMIKACFSDSSFFPAGGPATDLGLGASTVWKRRGSILALHALMKTWMMEGAPYLPEKLRALAMGDVSRPVAEQQEYHVLWYFCAAFVYCFGRAPTAPRI